MNKKNALFTTAGLVLILSVVGCSKGSGGDTAQETTATKAPDKRGQITVSIYDEGNIPSTEGTADNNRWTKWINEKGPEDVKFVPIPRAESVNKFNLLFASGSAPDYIQEFDSPFRNQLYEQKQIMPLDDLINKYSVEYKKIIDRYPGVKKLGSKPDGKLYEVGRVIGSQPTYNLYIRMDWLKKLNLEVPKTVDDLYNVAKAFADSDPDGNGKKDTFGIGMSFISGLIIDQMFQNFNTTSGEWEQLIVDSNDQLVPAWEQAKAATAFKKRLYEEGIVYKDYLADNKNGEKAKQDWLNGKLGMFGYGTWSPDALQMYETFKKNNPDAEVNVIALPKGAFGQFSSMQSPPIQMTGMINAKAKDPESVVKYIDFMSKQTTTKTIKYGIEGQHYKVGSNGCQQILDKDKYNKEVGWTIHYKMLDSWFFEGQCGKFPSTLNLDNPIEKEYAQIANKAYEVTVGNGLPIATFTHPQYMPSLPQDLQLVRKNAEKAVYDILTKSIVSGPSYSVDQAMNDAKAGWDKAGGKQLEDWYKKWYQDNKDKWVFAKDLPTLLK
ncbi:MAG: extracellular solute-binding protein [Paenibacillus sp.]|jgi:putative aldouronate transport system substrate-binding protein|nr:extracellular solute-binding protein [Paenibacillus sp.]